MADLWALCWRWKVGALMAIRRERLTEPLVQGNVPEEQAGQEGSIMEEFEKLRAAQAERAERWIRQMRAFAIGVIGSNCASLAAAVGIILAFN